MWARHAWRKQGFIVKQLIEKDRKEDQNEDEETM